MVAGDGDGDEAGCGLHRIITAGAAFPACLGSWAGFPVKGWGQCRADQQRERETMGSRG